MAASTAADATSPYILINKFFKLFSIQVDALFNAFAILNLF